MRVGQGSVRPARFSSSARNSRAPNSGAFSRVLSSSDRAASSASPAIAAAAVFIRAAASLATASSMAFALIVAAWREMTSCWEPLLASAASASALWFSRAFSSRRCATLVFSCSAATRDARVSRSWFDRSRDACKSATWRVFSANCGRRPSSSASALASASSSPVVPDPAPPPPRPLAPQVPPDAATPVTTLLPPMAVARSALVLAGALGTGFVFGPAAGALRGESPAALSAMAISCSAIRYTRRAS